MGTSRTITITLSKSVWSHCEVLLDADKELLWCKLGKLSCGAIVISGCLSAKAPVKRACLESARLLHIPVAAFDLGRKPEPLQNIDSENIHTGLALIRYRDNGSSAGQ